MNVGTWNEAKKVKLTIEIAESESDIFDEKSLHEMI